MRSNAEIEAYDIANILNNMMDTVRNNLVLLSGISTIQNQDVESSKKLFSDAQRTTSNTTSSYFLTEMVSYCGQCI
jgi:Fe2+ or Zn2+ uptake regulation protein